MLKHLNRLLPVALVLATIAVPALADSSADWMAPAQKGITDLTTQIVTLGGALIGLSIVAAGLWAAMTHRIEWSKLWIFFVAGLLVTIGPAAVTWFISKMQGG